MPKDNADRVVRDQGASSAQSLRSRVGQTSSVFVGREQEMVELGTALDDALAGRGCLVTLAGEPGIGKTRAAQALERTMQRRRNIKPQWSQTGCTE